MKYFFKAHTAMIMAYVLLIGIPISLSAQHKPKKNTSNSWESDWNTAPSPATKTKDTLNTSTWDTPIWNEADFVRQTKEGITAEIEFGELALQKATSEATRNYARQLIDDYTKARQDLTPSIIAPNGYNATSSVDTKGNRHLSETQPEVKSNLDEFNVSGSGLGTSGGTTGTALSRPDRPRKPTVNRPDVNNQVANASSSVGSGTADMTGSGFGAMNDGSAKNNGVMANTVPGSTSQSNASVSLSAEHQLTKDRLNNLAGASFDRQYVQAANQEHNTLIKELELATNEGSTSIQQWTSQYLPMMRRNRDLATQLKIH
jgi:predicted outer membrane protein